MKKGSKQTIMIVDDTPENINFLFNHLEKNNYKILIAKKGRDAIYRARQKKPDLILLDILMPEMNGFDTCKKLKMIPELSEIPVIFMSGITDKNFILKSFEVGGLDYIAKPINSEELLARIKTHLTIRNQNKIITNLNNNLLHINEQLRYSNIELEKVNATKDRFFSILAHDMKASFSGLLSLTQFLDETLDDLTYEKIKEITSKLYESTTSTYKLLENMLEWARIQKDMIEYKPESFDINQMMQLVIQICSQAANDKNIIIINNLPDGVFVNADFNMIITICRNLLSNAIKFTNIGGKITISSKILNEYIEISISDSGIGISKDIVKKLFQIDKKVQKTGTCGEKGTGLGLILCKELVEKNYGKIYVSSESGTGSTFSFILKKSINKNT